MDFLNSPINREEQLKKIVEDTDEILDKIKVIVESYDHYDGTMYNLGKRLANRDRENQIPIDRWSETI